MSDLEELAKGMLTAHVPKPIKGMYANAPQKDAPTVMFRKDTKPEVILDSDIIINKDVIRDGDFVTFKMDGFEDISGYVNIIEAPNDE